MQPIPDYCEHHKIEDFVQYVKEGQYNDWDGSCYLADEHYMYRIPIISCEDIIKYGINGVFTIHPKYTHICWFGK